MPAVTPIVLTDGTSPVTLNPDDRRNGKTYYSADTAATQSANETAQFSSSKSNDVLRQAFKTTSPVVGIVSETGETIVRDRVIIETTVRVPGVCSPEQQEAAVRRHFDALSSGALETELTTGEGQW
jgi:hypothetical protein